MRFTKHHRKVKAVEQLNTDIKQFMAHYGNMLNDVQVHTRQTGKTSAYVHRVIREYERLLKKHGKVLFLDTFGTYDLSTLYGQLHGKPVSYFTGCRSMLKNTQVMIEVDHVKLESKQPTALDLINENRRGYTFAQRGVFNKREV